MSVDFEIALEPMRLDEGTPEEQAAFGLFTLSSAGAFLTEGFDTFFDGSRLGPLVSGYHAAEWFACNWWRHHWEPRSNVPDWEMVHCMSTIGEGYVWPNVTIFSDGVRMTLVSDPSSQPVAEPFRFFGSHPAVIPLSVWETALDDYMDRICDRLRDSGVKETDLDRLWADIQADRADPEIGKRRRLEAMFGQDPDSGESDIVGQLIADADRFGEDVLGEIAAHGALMKEAAPLTASEFEQVAQKKGYEASQRDTVKLAANVDLPPPADVPAWRRGITAAKALREQEGLGDDPIENELLAGMAGTQLDVLTGDLVGDTGLSFILDDDSDTSSRLVMRSKWQTSRRFDLARLIGDRLVGGPGALHPAMRTRTYRQKAQRAFAAELLSPFGEVDGMLDDDYEDEESRDRVAAHFGVLPRTIETLLVNHGRLEQGFLEHDFGPEAFQQ